MQDNSNQSESRFQSVTRTRPNDCIKIEGDLQPHQRASYSLGKNYSFSNKNINYGRIAENPESKRSGSSTRFQLNIRTDNPPHAINLGISGEPTTERLMSGNSSVFAAGSYFRTEGSNQADYRTPHKVEMTLPCKTCIGKNISTSKNVRRGQDTTTRITYGEPYISSERIYGPRLVSTSFIEHERIRLGNYDCTCDKDGIKGVKQENKAIIEKMNQLEVEFRSIRDSRESKDDPPTQRSEINPKQVNDLQESLSKVINENARLVSLIDNLKSNLDEKENKISKLMNTKEVEKLKQRVKNLEKSNLELEERQFNTNASMLDEEAKISLENDLATLLQENKNSQKIIRQRNAEIENLRSQLSQLEEYNHESSTSNSEVQYLSSQLEETHREQRIAEDEIDKLKHELNLKEIFINDKNRRLKEVEEEKKTLLNRIEERDTELYNLRKDYEGNLGKLRGIEDDHNRKKHEIQEKEDCIDQLEDIVATLRSEISQYKADVSELENSLQRTRSLKEGAEKKLITMEEEFSDTTKAISEKDEKLLNFEIQLNEVKCELEDSRAIISQIKEQSGRLSKERNELISELNIVSQEREALSSQIERIFVDQDSQQKELSSLKSLVFQLEADSIDSKKELDDMLELKNRLKKENDDLRSEIESLRKQALKVNLTVSQEEFDNLKYIVHQKEENLKEEISARLATEEKIQSIQSTLQDTQNQLAIRNRQMDDLESDLANLRAQRDIASTESEEQRREFESHISTLQKRINQEQNEIKKLKEERDNWLIHKEELFETNGELNSRIENYVERISQLESKLASIEESHSKEFEEYQNSACDKMDQLRNEVMRMQKESNSKILSHNSQVEASLRKKIDYLEKELGQRGEEQEEFISQNTELQESLEEKKAELDALATVKAKQDEELKILKKEIRQLIAEFDAKEKTIATLYEDNKRLSSALTHPAPQLAPTASLLAQLRLELDSHRVSYESLKSSSLNARKDLASPPSPESSLALKSQNEHLLKKLALCYAELERLALNG